MGSAEPRELLLTSGRSGVRGPCGNRGRIPNYVRQGVDGAIQEDLEKLDEFTDYLSPISHRIVVDGPRAGGLSQRP